MAPMSSDSAHRGGEHTASSFTDPDAVARYRDGPPKQVPGFADLHRMTDLLVAERTPDDGRVLVLGAGGGLELKTSRGGARRLEVRRDRRRSRRSANGCPC
jgi:hypothetical protein